MSTIALDFALLCALQLFHPFLFSRDLLRGVPFVGLTAIAQCRCAIRESILINSGRRNSPKQSSL